MKPERLGPYRVVKKIGKGGMGAVYEAIYDAPGEHSGMRVAIKALSPQLAMAEGFRERFEAEIESLKKLQHDGIVRLYGYGEQDGILFYSMELVEGSSLEEELSSGRRFDWRETLHFGIQLCQALKHAHDHGVVHRDIKPANLLLTTDERIKIADFGIARLFGGTQLTTAGGVLGTADYMSPEQADGRTVNEKCDQYSLGGVMYALLAGRPPFRAKSMPEMLQLQRFAEPEPVRVYAPDTPAQLDRLLSQLLAKDPDARFPNVLVLGRHMEAMRKALSRPIQPKQEDKTGKQKDTFETDQTTKSGEEATNAIHPPVVLPHFAETDEAALELYDAPTVAEPPQSNASQAAATSKPTSAPSQKPPSSRFTSVDEEARRQRELARGSPVLLIIQLAGLATVLGFLIWGGWLLMQPPTADELFEKITKTVDEQGLENLRVVSSELDDFLSRFPEDSRIEEVKQYRQQLEFQRFLRQAHRKSRIGGPGGMNPIESIYFSATAIAESDPARALKMLHSLLALYDPGNESTGDRSPRLAENVEDSHRRWLLLVRQQIEKMEAQAKQQAVSQLPVLQERLAAAEKLRRSHPIRAKRMIQAIVDLYGDQPWAQEIVEQARRALTEEP